MTEYWEVKWVQFRPGHDEVLIIGAHVVELAEGRTVRESGTIGTTQAELTAACPEGVDVWGDDEVAAIVEASKQIDCTFMPAPPLPPSE